MNLVIFTYHYPYGIGEDFLEEEIRVAEKKFNNILIVSYAKNTEKLNKFVPKNTTVIRLREHANYITEYIVLLRYLFFVRFWKELFEGYRERGIVELKNTLKKILSAERHISYLQRNEHYWVTGEFDNRKTIYYSYWLSSSALYLARNKRKLNGLCIARTHGGDCFFSRGFIPWRKHILSKLDAIFPISNSGRLDIFVHYGQIVNGLSDKMHVARIGVDLPVRYNKNNKKDSTVTIVSCSAVIPLKRLDLLIDALALCNFVDINWVHFGDGVLMKQIKNYAKQKLTRNTRITYSFLGRVQKEKILEYYNEKRVDLFINCSDAEGIPVSAMEAMSYGIPVIARNVGGNAELVDNNCGFLLHEIITPKDLTNAIKTVLFSEDGILYEERCVNAYNKIAESYTAEKNYESFFAKIHSYLLVLTSYRKCHSK